MLDKSYRNRFTRKHYILIAEALRDARKRAVMPGEKDGIDYAVMTLANHLHVDNPRFSQPHFISVVRGEKDLHSHPSRKAVQSYRVHLGGKRYRKFTTLEDARTFCDTVARETGEILSVVQS